ncbi:peptide synthetase [Nocardia bovistercoris]|uniref:Peptide synthetase n=1 Tax=Nocardia bovistercoris TaxID=2785916 RepID=A0A931N1T2_9NOCA|nr:peptide synthetase [Nocardia bovistercoris]MBH0774788.1 peptide synthetase [Nocardia bovistercoris]
MGNDTVFRRAISPTERMYHPMRQVAPPFLMQLALPGDGALDPARLRHAVEVASAASPGARLVRSGAHWVDSGRAPRVIVVQGHTLSRIDLEADPIITAPLEPDTTVEVMLLTGDPVTVVLRVFHGVMDGMGMVLWMRDIFRVLRGHDPVGHPDPVADRELVRRLGAPGLPALMVPRFRSAVGAGRQRTGAPRHLLRRRTVDATVSNPVAKISALLAARTAGTTRVMIPVDLRRHDPALRSTANLALPLFLDIPPGLDWVAVKEQMKSGLRGRHELNQMAATRLTDIPESANRVLLRALNGLGARFGRNLASATVSHMGRFDLDELACPEFRPTSIFMLPQHSVAMPLLFTVLESGGRTELGVSVRNGDGVRARLDSLLDLIAAELEQDAARHEATASSVGRGTDGP